MTTITLLNPIIDSEYSIVDLMESDFKALLNIKSYETHRLISEVDLSTSSRSPRRTINLTVSRLSSIWSIVEHSKAYFPLPNSRTVFPYLIGRYSTPDSVDQNQRPLVFSPRRYLLTSSTRLLIADTSLSLRRTIGFS